MSKFGAGVRLLKLLKIQELLNDMNEMDNDFRYDVCFEDTGLIVENDMDEIHLENLINTFKVMISIAKLEIEPHNLK